MRFTKLYLDLDGVFADFDQRKDFLLSNSHPGLTTDQKWGIIDKDRNFFLKLLPLPNAKTSFEMLRKITSDHGLEMEMLTALPDPTCELITAPRDKIDWVRKELCDRIPVNCAKGWERKVHWVHPTHILIDDMQRNIDHWNEAGGHGIHHDGNWNNTIQKLVKSLHK